jgi:hypothetical protein
MHDEITRIYQLGGTSTWAALAIDRDEATTGGARRQAALDELDRQGAPAADIAAVGEALAPDTGVAAPATRHLIAHAGEIVFAETLEGIDGPDVLGTGPVPDLSRLLQQRSADIHYLVVEADREGGEIRLCRARRPHPETREHVVGWEDELHKVPSGGLSDPSRQQRTEETWKQNQAMLAERVDRIVREWQPRFILLAGDVRADELLVRQLAPASRDLVVSVGTHTGAPGASDAAILEHLDDALERVVERERGRVADKLSADHGDRGAHGLGPVVEALRAAEVDTLLLSPARVAERTVLALDAAPWIANAPEDALAAGILGEVPAVSALLRAAVLTDAAIVFDDEDPLDESGITAALRWAPGPAVPGR